MAQSVLDITVFAVQLLYLQTLSNFIFTYFPFFVHPTFCSSTYTLSEFSGLYVPSNELPYRIVVALFPASCCPGLSSYRAHLPVNFTSMWFAFMNL